NLLCVLADEGGNSLRVRPVTAKRNAGDAALIWQPEVRFPVDQECRPGRPRIGTETLPVEHQRLARLRQVQLGQPQPRPSQPEAVIRLRNKIRLQPLTRCLQGKLEMPGAVSLEVKRVVREDPQRAFTVEPHEGNEILRDSPGALRGLPAFAIQPQQTPGGAGPHAAIGALPKTCHRVWRQSLAGEVVLNGAVVADERRPAEQIADPDATRRPWPERVDAGSGQSRAADFPDPLELDAIESKQAPVRR